MRILFAMVIALSLGPVFHAHVPQEPDATKAKVFVYMPHHSATTWRFSGKFYVDGRRVAEISKNRYFVLHLAPGSHEFYVRDKKLGGLQLTLEPSETYYLKVNVDEGHARIKFRGLTVVPEGEGGFAIKQIQPIKKDDIYDKNLVDPDVVTR